MVISQNVYCLQQKKSYLENINKKSKILIEEYYYDNGFNIVKYNMEVSIEYVLKKFKEGKIKEGSSGLYFGYYIINTYLPHFLI